MQVNCTRVLASAFATVTLLVAGLGAPTASARSDQQLFITLGAPARPPFGWVNFCAEYAPECETKPLEARDVVLTPKAWTDLGRINKWVNDSVWPITDMDHWGVIDRWNYPDDGYGDCEDYVLLKRKITVVLDRNGDGHAVLTVKSDKGEFILDNQSPEILLWSETGYHFVKRQSQNDPNNWIGLGDPRPAVATATSR
jgi:predicted transglutaminase-like cysteine proteinase